MADVASSKEMEDALEQDLFLDDGEDGTMTGGPSPKSQKRSRVAVAGRKSSGGRGRGGRGGGGAKFAKVGIFMVKFEGLNMISVLHSIGNLFRSYLEASGKPRLVRGFQ